MSVLYLVLPVSLVLVVGAVVLFIWAVKGGQMDDLKTPAYRVLFEDDDDAGIADVDTDADDITERSEPM